MGINMSDSLYRSELRSTIRPKLKGTLQFSQSTLSRDARGLSEGDPSKFGYNRRKDYESRRFE